MSIFVVRAIIVFVFVTLQELFSLSGVQYPFLLSGSRVHYCFLFYMQSTLHCPWSICGVGVPSCNIWFVGQNLPLLQTVSFISLNDFHTVRGGNSNRASYFNLIILEGRISRCETVDNCLVNNYAFGNTVIQSVSYNCTVNSSMLGNILFKK